MSGHISWNLKIININNKILWFFWHSRKWMDAPSKQNIIYDSKVVYCAVYYIIFNYIFLQHFVCFFLSQFLSYQIYYFCIRFLILFKSYLYHGLYLHSYSNFWSLCLPNYNIRPFIIIIFKLSTQQLVGYLVIS